MQQVITQAVTTICNIITNSRTYRILVVPLAWPVNEIAR